MSKLQQLATLCLVGVISMNLGFAQEAALEGSSRFLVWMPQANRSAKEAITRRRSPNARFYDSIPIASVRLTPAERTVLEAELGPGSIFEDREYRTNLLPSTTIPRPRLDVGPQSRPEAKPQSTAAVRLLPPSP